MSVGLAVPWVKVSGIFLRNGGARLRFRDAVRGELTLVIVSYKTWGPFGEKKSCLSPSPEKNSRALLNPEEAGYTKFWGT